MKSGTVKVLDKASSVFTIQGPGKGVLCIHGFTGTPYEMKYLGSRFLDKGWSVSIPRLPGHGTCIEEMLNTGFRDWLIAGREAYIELASLCNPVYIVGVSMGGIIAIHIAAEFPVEKLVLISVPRTFREKAVYLAPTVGRFIPIIPSRDTSRGLLDEEARASHVCYDDGVPVRQAWQVFRAAKRAMRLLPRVTADALIIQSRLDQVIPPDSIDYIYTRIGSKDKRKVFLEHSGHTATVDREKSLVADMVIDFFEGTKQSKGTR